jgi:hypothetical protein
VKKFLSNKCKPAQFYWQNTQIKANPSALLAENIWFQAIFRILYDHSPVRRQMKDKAIMNRLSAGIHLHRHQNLKHPS